MIDYLMKILKLNIYHLDYTNLEKLKYEITSNLDNIKSDKIILLYGSKCHYMFIFLRLSNLITFKDSNCMNLIVGDEKNIIMIKIYITPGWVIKFDELNKFINAVDIYDIRQQYGRYENVIIGDTKVCEFTDEMILIYLKRYKFQ